MASPEEIGHSRHRQELISELRSIVENFVRDSNWSVCEKRHSLRAYDGNLLGYTIRDQTLQAYWKFNLGAWVQIDVASTGANWDALVIITSSEMDRDAIIPQGEDSRQAVEALHTVLASLKHR